MTNLKDDIARLAAFYAEGMEPADDQNVCEEYQWKYPGIFHVSMQTIRRLLALNEAMEWTAMHVLDGMQCIADYDSETQEPIWQTDESKKTTNCCIQARDELQATLIANRKAIGD